MRNDAQKIGLQPVRFLRLSRRPDEFPLDMFLFGDVDTEPDIFNQFALLAQSLNVAPGDHAPVAILCGDHHFVIAYRTDGHHLEQHLGLLVFIAGKQGTPPVLPDQFVGGITGSAFDCRIDKLGFSIQPEADHQGRRSFDNTHGVIALVA